MTPMDDTVQVHAELIRRHLPCGCEVGYVRCEEGLRLWERMDKLYWETFRDDSKGTYEAYEAAAAAVDAHFGGARAECPVQSGDHLTEGQR